MVNILKQIIFFTSFVLRVLDGTHMKINRINTNTFAYKNKQSAYKSECALNSVDNSNINRQVEFMGISFPFFNHTNSVLTKNFKLAKYQKIQKIKLNAALLSKIEKEQNKNGRKTEVKIIKNNIEGNGNTMRNNRNSLSYSRQSP